MAQTSAPAAAGDEINAMLKPLVFAALMALPTITSAATTPYPGMRLAPPMQAPRPMPAPRLWSLDISTTSYHTRRWARDSLNQDNPGLGIEYQATPDWGAAAGFYKNSYSRTSVYALATYTPLHISLPEGFRVGLGWLAGVISGYTSAEAPGRPLMAAALLEIRSAQGSGINLVAVPNAGQSAGFVGLQLVVPLG